MNRNDLFALFPDLPWHPRRAAGDREKVHRQVRATKVRVEEHVTRQRAAAERVRAAIQRRRSDVRKP